MADEEENKNTDQNTDTDKNIDKDTGIDTTKPLIKGDLKKSFMFSAEALTEAAAAADTKHPQAPAFEHKKVFKSPDEMTVRDIVGENKSLGEVAAAYDDPETAKLIDVARAREAKRTERSKEEEGKSDDELKALREKWEAEDEDTAAQKVDRDKELEGKTDEEQEQLKAKWKEEDTADDGEKAEKKSERKEKPSSIKVTREPRIPARDDDHIDDDHVDDGEAERQLAAKQLESELTDDDKTIISDLADEAKETLNFYKQAELADPGNFKGAYRTHLDYLKALDAKIQEALEEDPDGELEENEKLVAWIDRHKPEYSRADLNRVRDEILKNQIRDETEEKYERRLRNIEQKPEIQKATQAFSDRVFDSTLDSKDETVAEVVALIDEKGLEAAREEFPEEVEVFERVYRNSTKQAETFISMRRGLIDYDKADSTHKGIVDSINKFNDDAVAEIANQDIDTDGVKDGKPFAHIKKWMRMTSEEQENHWTFQTGDLLALMANKAKVDTETGIKEESDRKYQILERQAKKSGIPIEKLITRKAATPAPDKDKDEKPGKKDAKEEAAESASVTANRDKGSVDKDEGTHTGKDSFAVHGLAALRP